MYLHAATVKVLIDCQRLMRNRYIFCGVGFTMIPLLLILRHISPTSSAPKHVVSHWDDFIVARRIVWARSGFFLGYHYSSSLTGNVLVSDHERSHSYLRSLPTNDDGNRHVQNVTMIDVFRDRRHVVSVSGYVVLQSGLFSASECVSRCGVVCSL